MKKILLLFYFLPLLVFSQRGKEPRVAPQPFESPVAYDSINKTGIKTVTILRSTSTKSGKTVRDTQFVYMYNKSGVNTTVESYRNNELNNTCRFIRKNGRLIELSVESEFSSEIIKTLYKYDALGNCIMEQYLEMLPGYETERGRKDTTTNEITKRWFKENKLHREQLFVEGTYGVIDSFFYKDNRLDMYKNYFSPRKEGLLDEVHYIYNERGELDSTVNILKRTGERRKEKAYVYDNDLLIEETELKRTSRDTTTTKINYSYSEGRLKSMETRSGDEYEKVEITHADTKISNIKVTKNSVNKLNFSIPDLSGYSLPITYEEQRSYDAKGNLTGEKILINSTLFIEIFYSIAYY
ncbi:MAG: hypothetical protein V4651_07715 [Bacteroidota bacterium]